jgi:dipeptidyl aminopeptidase/acylaminoacyl peptidase
VSLTEIIETASIDGVSFSPDGRWISYRTVSRSVDLNRTALQWHVVATDGKQTIPLGGPLEPTWVPMFDSVEEADQVWSPASDAIYIRGLTPEGVQVLRLGLDGTRRQVTHDEADVTSFALRKNGDGIDYVVRNARSTIALGQAREKAMGIHFDGGLSTEGLRITDNFSIGERVTALRFSGDSAAEEAFGGQPRTKSILFSVTERSPAPPRQGSKSPYKSDDGTAGSRNSLVTVRITDRGALTRFQASRRLYVEAADASGASRICSAEVCSGSMRSLKAAFLVPGRNEVVIAYERATSGRTVLYRWDVDTGSVRKIADPGGLLDGGGFRRTPCAQSGALLACAYSGPSTPPRVVTINLETAKIAALANPNAALDARDFGKTRFLSWRDAEGREGTGKLILPSAFSGRLPLVITTNSCSGFLRGGSSYLISEHVLAAHGFAALCINTNGDNELAPQFNEKTAVLAPHKASLASYQAAIALLDRMGIIDPDRVGIAGHSFSANVTAYAVSHTRLFKAAVLGGAITIDPWVYQLTTATPDSRRSGLWSSFLNLPPLDNDPDGSWSKISPSLHAARIEAPVLMELPESEYLNNLELYRQIRRTGGIADMFIFPNEGHWLGREPVHAYWRQLRALNWFAYWLQGERRGPPEMIHEVEQWADWQAQRDRQLLSLRLPSDARANP